jgi:Arginine deiminase
VGSEVGRLRTVVLHRPGPELARLTPRNHDDLLFDGVPWLERAQEEHDQLANVLRAHDVEVLYLHELLAEVLDVPEARDQLLDSALRPGLIGPALVPAAGRPHADEDERRRRGGHRPARSYLRRLAASCSAGQQGILGNPAARRTDPTHEHEQKPRQDPPRSHPLAQTPPRRGGSGRG